MAPLLTTMLCPPQALTISRAPLIQLRLRWPAPPSPASSCLTRPRVRISIMPPARCSVLTMPRLSGNGSRGEADGSSVTSVGEKAEGGESDRHVWEKAGRDVGAHERSDVEAGKREAVALDWKETEAKRLRVAVSWDGTRLG